MSQKKRVRYGGSVAAPEIAPDRCHAIERACHDATRDESDPERILHTLAAILSEHLGLRQLIHLEAVDPSPPSST